MVRASHGPIILSTLGAAAAIAILAACSSSRATQSITPTPAAGACYPARAHAAGDSTGTIQSGNMPRTFILHVPTGYDGSKPLPLLFDFHGASSDKEAQNAYSAFSAKGDAEGFIVITPDGTGTPRSWNFLSLGTIADDVGFVRDLLDQTEASLCVDPTRVYAAGLSSGGYMALSLACDLQGRITAVAAVAAMFRLPTCPSTRSVPMLEFHGTDDPIIPFHGGDVAALPAPDVQQGTAVWAGADECASTPQTTQVSPHVTRQSYGECNGGVSVQLYVIDGGGHTWPGARADVAALGGTTHEINATDIMWQFFVAQPPLPASSGKPTPTPGPETLLSAWPVVTPSSTSARAIAEAAAPATLDAAMILPADLGPTWKVVSDNTLDNAGAEAVDSNIAGSAQRCGRLLGRTVVTQPSTIVNDYLTGKTVSYFSQATLYATTTGAVDCANADVARYRHPGQLARAFGTVFVDPDKVVVEPVDFPQIGDGSAAVTLRGQTNASGTVVDIVVLAAVYRQGSVVGILGSVAWKVPSTSELSPLVDKVVQRVAVAQ
jgi:polyhydroxybutyrate depolymerase